MPGKRVSYVQRNLIRLLLQLTATVAQGNDPHQRSTSAQACSQHHNGSGPGNRTSTDSHAKFPYQKNRFTGLGPAAYPTQMWDWK